MVHRLNPDLITSAFHYYSSIGFTLLTGQTYYNIRTQGNGLNIGGLHIIDAQYYHSGTYKCIAKTTSDRTEALATLTVKGKYLTSHSLTSTLNAKLRITVTITLTTALPLH